MRAFDWRAAFPELWSVGGDGGFDIVLGNPPYVKLQNLMKVAPDVVAYLAAERGSDTYRSARTGNFDLYLPFIEKGLRLLAPGGRMAFIAPSLWAVNLVWRGLAKPRAPRPESRSLARLQIAPDFRRCHHLYSAAVFHTRTAQRRANRSAPNGEMADIDWSDPDLAVPYGSMPGNRRMADRHRRGTGADRAVGPRLPAARRFSR